MSGRIEVRPWQAGTVGLTRHQYDALVASGELVDAPVELLEGELVRVSPQGPRHARTIRALDKHLNRRLDERLTVAVQTPLAATDTSEPEPDLAVIDEPEDGHPITAHLVIEVTEHTHRADLQLKPVIYAAAGVTEYWVVDLPHDEVVVHRGLGASPDGVPAPHYQVVEHLPMETVLDAVGVPVCVADFVPVRGRKRA